MLSNNWLTYILITCFVDPRKFPTDASSSICVNRTMNPIQVCILLRTNLQVEDDR